MRIAMISEHASPLAHLGGVDAGGQNVHVAELSCALARRGHDVVVYTRRDDPRLPDSVETPHGYSVVHVPAGPARVLPKDELLQYMYGFAQFLRQQWCSDGPDVAHAHQLEDLVGAGGRHPVGFPGDPGFDVDPAVRAGVVAALVQPLGQPERVEGLHGRYRMRAGGPLGGHPRHPE
ncbi:glycosyltransferase, partial [Mycobacterium avium]|uniref:glycosyltransferase n=1 Tax=Mycobacterium avium TaxID=1764 RepID=UPI001EE71F96